MMKLLSLPLFFEPSFKQALHQHREVALIACAAEDIHGLKLVLMAKQDGKLFPVFVRPLSGRSAWLSLFGSGTSPLPCPYLDWPDRFEGWRGRRWAFLPDWLGVHSQLGRFIMLNPAIRLIGRQWALGRLFEQPLEFRRFRTSRHSLLPPAWLPRSSPCPPRHKLPTLSWHVDHPEPKRLAPPLRQPSRSF